MNASAEQVAPSGAELERTRVRVSRNVRGDWEIALPDEGERVVCDTLEGATEVAYGWATRRRPSEVIVVDAYNRVSRRDVLTPV
jgi:hypothetical protein